MLRFFNFSKWRTPPTWIFKFVKFHWQTVPGRQRLIIVLNVVKIGRLVVEILQFFEFSKWPLPSWIFRNREILLRVETHQHAKLRQNRSISCDIEIFYFSRWRLPPSWIVEFTKFHWLTVAGWPRRITSPNFIKTDHSIMEMLQFFEFSNWPPPSCIFEIVKFYWLLGSRGWRRISVPNFVKIGPSVAKILRFFSFSRWLPSAILDLFAAYLDHL